MKRALFLSMVMVMVAGVAFAQGGAFGVYEDPDGLVCDLIDAVSGLKTVYVVHTMTPGATASQFAAPATVCMVTLLWLSDTALFPVTIGNSQDGVAIGYGTCLMSPIAAIAINFFANGLTAPCCEYPVVPDPNVPSGEIEVVDCDGNLIFGTGRISVWNSDDTCLCAALPTETTTWGSVKALYSD